MISTVRLRPEEIVPERPFCHPQASENDIHTLQFMRAQLRSLLTDSSKGQDEERPVHFDWHDDNGAVHRMVLPDWRSLQVDRDVVAVGFFGQIRPNVDHKPIMDLENKLMAQLPNAPGLLTYYNLHMPGEGYGNLVLFRNEAAKDDWRHVRAHDEAVRLTPNHYYSVRLHNGVIRGGVMSHHDLNLVRTKYYDFRGTAVWRAVREFSS